MEKARLSPLVFKAQNCSAEHDFRTGFISPRLIFVFTSNQPCAGRYTFLFADAVK